MSGFQLLFNMGWTDGSVAKIVSNLAFSELIAGVLMTTIYTNRN